MTDRTTRQAPTVRPVSAEAGHHPLLTLRGEIDRLFDNFFPAAFGRSLFELDPWRPGTLRVMGDMTLRVDVKELADHYEVAAELPGVEAKDVKVTVDKGMLGISGEKHEEHAEEKGDVRLSERSFGSFVRTFKLPEDADEGNVGAEFVNGVLTVTVPKLEGKAPTVKDIEIKDP